MMMFDRDKCRVYKERIVGIFVENFPLCESCGDMEAEYRCDECGKCFCVDCAPYREDDDPFDLCEECAE